MADNILRLKVQSDEYDAKLKKAAEGIRHLAEVAHKGGGELTGLEKAELDYIKALGDMETKSRTAAGSVRELESTFKELTVVYNHLNDVEKADEGGKALAKSLETLKQRAIDAKKALNDASQALEGTESKSSSSLFSSDKLSGMLQVFGGNLMTKGFELATGAISSMANEIGDSIKQGVELAKQGEGVRIAFERLGRGDILEGLREATHGTVTDIELMKAAVQFNDFKLPLDQLGTMLAFAQQKAKDTGQSVDYLVQSIVTGLGRKSLMILDNLGLSANEIKEKMKETGDMTKAVGAIIREQMAKAGDYVETAADRAAQANVSLQNKMEELGRKFGPVEEASSQLWTSMKIAILDIVGGPLARLLNSLTEAGRLKNALNDMNGDDGSGNTKVGQQLKKLQVIKKAGGSDYIFSSTLSGMMEDYNRQIMELDKQIKDTKKLSPDQQASKFVRDEVQKMSEQMKAIGVMRDQLAAGAKEIANPTPAPTTPVVQPTKTTNPTKPEKTDIQFADDSIMAQEKLVSDLTQKWKTASGELRDGYLKDLEEAQQKLAEMTGKAKGDGAPTFTMSQLEGISFDNQIPTTRGNEGKAQDKLDLATAAFATSGTSNVDFSNYTAALQNAIKDANLGSELYTQLSEQLSDSSQVSQLLQQYVANGITGADLGQTAQELKAKLMNGEIDDDVIQQYVDELNAKLMEKFDEAEWPNVLITFDADTKNIVNAAQQQEKEAQKMTKNWQAAGSAIQAVGAAMNQIEDPAAKVLGTIAQAVATMALSYSQAAASPAVTGTGWGWIAFAATGVATMLSSIAAIKQATAGFANGGVIPGNSMSGDNLRGITPDGTVYGLNSQEIILNRAQQGNLASQLEGGGMENLHLDTVIGAEDIRLVLNNNGRRTGRGEYVQTNRR